MSKEELDRIYALPEKLEGMLKDQRLLQDRMKQLHAQRDDLSRRLEKTEEELREANSFRAQSMQDIEAIQKKYVDSQKELNHAQAEFEELQGQLAAAKKEQNEQLAAGKKEQAAQQQEIHDLTKQSEADSRRAAEMQSKARLLEEERDSKKHQIADIHSALMETRGEVDSLRGLLEKTRSKTQRVEGLENELSAAREELRSLISKKQHAEEINLQLERECAAAKSRLEVAEKRATTLQENEEEARRKLNEEKENFRNVEAQLQQVNIRAALAERRHCDIYDIEPVIKIRPESSGVDVLFQIAICCGDKAATQGKALETADPVELPLLQHSKQLDLKIELQIPDLIEEDRSPCSLFKYSMLSLWPRARKGSFFVAE